MEIIQRKRNTKHEYVCFVSIMFMSHRRACVGKVTSGVVDMSDIDDLSFVLEEDQIEDVREYIRGAYLQERMNDFPNFDFSIIKGTSTFLF